MTVIAQNNRQEPELKLINKLGFGFGDAGQGIVASLLGWFFNAFLLDVVGMRPALVGVIFGVSLLWDGITDPLIGILSDRTKTRWGSKRPWLLYGAIPFGLTYIFAWIVPAGSQASQFWYYFAVSLLLKTAFTAVSVPYTALTPELSNDYDERTQLNFYRFSFSLLGALIAVFLHPYLVSLGSTTEEGHFISAVVWAVVVAVATWVAFYFTFERNQSRLVQDDNASLLEDIKIAWRNKPYLIVTALYLLSWLSMQFIQVNLLLYMRYWFGDETQLPFMVLVLQLTTILFLWIWAQASKHIGKRATYIVGVAFWLVAQVGLFITQPGQTTLLFSLAVFGGMGIAVAFLIPWSMIPDVIDYGELTTGKRREGIFYGGFIFLQKFGLAAVIFLSNIVLDLSGYVNPDAVTRVIATQPDTVVLWLRLFVSLIPGVVLLLSIPLVMKYPITRERYDAIVKELEHRRKQKPS